MIELNSSRECNFIQLHVGNACRYIVSAVLMCQSKDCMFSFNEIKKIHSD